MKRISLFGILLLFSFGVQIYAECPLDHLIIGINEDGIDGTDDDNKLFVDCRQKYRDSGSPSYIYWYYPLNTTNYSNYTYRIAEPGFDAFQNTNSSAAYTYDPNRCLDGTPDTDYRLIIECVSISPDTRIVHSDLPSFTIDEIGESFNHSEIQAARDDGHMHLSYQSQNCDRLCWVTWQIYDEIEDDLQYETSEPFTIVFNLQPSAGDLVVDGIVDENDLAEFCYYWFENNGSIYNDYYERADANRDGLVNLSDFALLAENWLQ